MTSRTRRTISRIGVSSALMLVISIAPAGAGTPHVGQSGSKVVGTNMGPTDVESQPTRAEQVRFRRGLGLETADAALSDAASANNSSAAQFGVPLTDSELAELLRRDQVIRDDASVARKAVLDAFGERTLSGVWMDNVGGGMLTVAVTHSPEAIRGVLLSAVRHPSALRVVIRRHSLVDLERLAGTLRDLSASHGIEISGIRLDERANVVRVLAIGDVDRTRRWVEERLGFDAPVTVEPGEVVTVGTQYTNSPPLRGGQAINSSVGTTCTSAFTARGPSGLYVLSAGHCSASGATWDQVGTPIGVADRSDVTGTDVLRIPASTTPLTNEVTLWYTPTMATEARYQKITSSQTSTSDAVGQISCITGQNFADLRCGEIVTRAFDVSTRTRDGRLLTYPNGREIDADCNPGDSGGPALRGAQARGIVSVKVTRTLANDTCVYVHIDIAMSQIGVTDVLVDGIVLGPI